MDESSGHGGQRGGLPADPFPPWVRRSARVRVLGHRGARVPGRPENSVAAVNAALRRGADGVEIDVRLTADGTPICSHDTFALTRTRERRDVATCDRSDLPRLATLAELLAAVQRPDGVQLVVEAKPVTGPAAAARTASALADVLCGAVGNAHVTVSSFDPDLLAVIRRTCADLPVRTALLGDKPDAAALVVRHAHVDRHDEVHLPLVGVRRTPGAVGLARRLGLGVALWTVNERHDLRWAAELGVAAVITDDVPGARRELDRAPVGEPAVTAAVAAA